MFLNFFVTAKEVIDSVALVRDTENYPKAVSYNQCLSSDTYRWGLYSDPDIVPRLQGGCSRRWYSISWAVQKILHLSAPRSGCLGSEIQGQAFKMPDHLRSAEGATAQNNALASLDLSQQILGLISYIQPSTMTYDGFADFAGMSPIPRGNVCNSDSFIAFKDDSGDSSVGVQKEVMLNVHDAVDVCYAKLFRAEIGDYASTVPHRWRHHFAVQCADWCTWPRFRRHETSPSLQLVSILYSQESKMQLALNVITERYADSMRRSQKIMSESGDLSTIADRNRTVISMSLTIRGFLIVFQLEQL